MRCTVFLVGVLICMGLLLSRRASHSVSAPAIQRAVPVAQPSSPGQAPGPTWTVTGEPQLNPELAIEDALDKSATKVRDYLRDLNPPVDWMPTPEDGRAYVRDHLLRDLRSEEDQAEEPADVTTKEILINGSRWAVEEERQLKDRPGMRLYRVRVKVGVSPQELTEIKKVSHDEHVRNRKQRMEQRMLPLAQVLGGLVALLAAVAGYVRLDEWSKGYYRRWLRLGAAGFVSVAWVVLSWPVLHLLVKSFFGE
ncbi:MAG TPA: hypothetical protein VG013_33610 [Gemmataceae bacterium]|jgi:hypothetical protein|nr:hypothetical protein [Gemmataceae bacterium]